MSKRRVVITGLGCVSPLGNTTEDTWLALINGRSGAATITSFPTDHLPVTFSCSVKNFNAEPEISHKDLKKMDMFVQFGIIAAIEAINNSGLDLAQEDKQRIGVAIGSGIGGLPYIQMSCDILTKSNARKISPFFIPASIINMVSGNLSIRYGFQGPNIAIVTACTTGTHNIGEATRIIQYDDADVMIAGGAEMATCELGIAGFAAARALSKRNDDPQAASRPWDRDRDGFVLGDGAGIVVLEEYEHAKKRGAKIYAEVIGFGMSGDAYHMTTPSPDGSGAMLCMQNALRDARIAVDTVDYINAHGTSTQVGDAAETVAIKHTFGAQAKRLAISSTKSMTGHLLGAAGGVEAVFTALSIYHQIAPPTINLENPDPECDLDYVPHTAREMKIDVALSNSFGFGGTNGTLALRRLT